MSLKIEELKAIFFGNLGELLDRIVWFEDPQISENLMSRDHEPQRLEIHREIFRLLHNFLAGVATLIDHTRVLTNEIYADRPFKAEYDAKVKELFGNAPMPGFVKDLRNWMVHKGAVPLCIISKLTLDEAVTTRFMLRVSDLQTWDGWKAQAKSFLAEAPDDINLAALVRSYGDLVRNFYGWLSVRFSEVHAQEFEELARLRQLYVSVRPIS
jgi:hypothetical protein